MKAQAFLNWSMQQDAIQDEKFREEMYAIMDEELEQERQRELELEIWFEVRMQQEREEEEELQIWFDVMMENEIEYASFDNNGNGKQLEIKFEEKRQSEISISAQPILKMAMMENAILQVAEAPY